MRLSVIAVSSLPRTSRSVDRDGVTPDISTAQGGSSTIRKHLRVFVRNNNVDQALRVPKKKMQREGVFREVKRRKAYEKPSERKTREKAEAVRRARKAARKQAQREALSPCRKSGSLRPVGRRCPGRSEFAANTLLTLSLMHSNAAAPCTSRSFHLTTTAWAAT